MPELWLPPAPGAPVLRAAGADRDAALFLDQMEQPLAVGLDQNGEPIMADFAFLNGEKGGHVSISGISGVATKTSYALFLLYMLFETAARPPAARRARAEHARPGLQRQGRGPAAPRPPERAVRPRRERARRAGARSASRSPAPFRRVRLYAPRSERSREGSLATDVVVALEATR